MLTNRNDRNVHRLPKDTSEASSLHKKCNVPHLIPRLKSDRLKKPKAEPFVTPRQKTHHNCLPAPEAPRRCKKPTLTLKMKSVSLVDLQSEEKTKAKICLQRKTISREQEDNPKTTNVVENRSNNIFNFASARESELAKYVCRKLIVHTWRKRRAEVNKLQLVIKSREKEVENVSVQKFVLKTLLESEKERVKLAFKELNLVKMHLEKEQNISKDLNEHLSKREKSFTEEKFLWRSAELKMKEEIESFKSKLDEAVKESSRLIAKALSYKQKYEDSGKNEVLLKDMLDASEISLKDKTNDINTLKNKCLDLQITVDGLVTRNQELAREKERKERQICEYIKNLKNVEVELNNFQNIQKVHGADFVKLRKDYETVKTQINNKDSVIECLQETVRLYETEEKQLKNKFKKVTLRVFQLTLNLIPLPNYLPF